MKSAVVVLTLLVFALLLPFTEGSPEKRSLDITSLTINFDKTDAEFIVNYDIGKLPRLYVLLLGSKSIETKINAVFSNFDYTITKMDQSSAVFRVKNISRFDKGYYLHDSHRFGETINTVIIYTPDSPRTREYYSLNSTPNIFYRS